MSEVGGNIYSITQSDIQMPTPKVGLFGTPLKIRSKIRKISKFQTNTEIALVDEIHRNLRQMEALGSYFRKKLKFWIFVDFYMLCTYLNIAQIRIFRNYQKYRKSMVFGTVLVGIEWIFSKFFLLDFFLKAFPENCSR